MVITKERQIWHLEITFDYTRLTCCKSAQSKYIQMQHRQNVQMPTRWVPLPFQNCLQSQIQVNKQYKFNCIFEQYISEKNQSHTLIIYLALGSWARVVSWPNHDMLLIMLIICILILIEVHLVQNLNQDCSLLVLMESPSCPTESQSSHLDDLTEFSFCQRSQYPAENPPNPRTIRQSIPCSRVEVSL